MSNQNRLTEREILILVAEYIGSEGGYLNNFSYATHNEFYARYCDLNIDVSLKRKDFGTTRATYIGILNEATAEAQIRIVEGTFEYFRKRDQQGLSKEQSNARELLAKAVERIRSGPVVPLQNLTTASEAVRLASSNAAVLLREQGPKCAVDRVHTAFHGFLKAVCIHANVTITKSHPAAHELWGDLKKSGFFRALLSGEAEPDTLERLLSSMGGIVSATETLRNRLSLVHPNPTLVEEDEAVLAIDAMNALANYLSRKLRN